MSAISKTDTAVVIVTEEEMRNEKLYEVTMSHARRMLSQGLITEEEYAVFDTKMQEKYRPVFGTLFSDINLTSQP